MVRRFTCLGALILAVGVASSALSADISAAMSKEPTFQQHVSKGIFVVERCIVMLDMPDVATVYRTPDRPDESLIYWPAVGGKPVVKLVSDKDGTTLTGWNVKSTREKLERCLIA